MNPYPDEVYYEPVYEPPPCPPCPPCPSCEGMGSDGFSMPMSPMGFLMSYAKCILIGLAIFAIILWAISKVPVIGPWVRNTVLWILTKLMEFAGLANCGFANEFDDVLEAES